MQQKGSREKTTPLHRFKKQSRMRVIKTPKIFAGILFLVVISAKSETARLQTQTLSGGASIKSWKTLRDAGLVKQDYDFSCGASSLATVLNEYYGQNLTEEILLKAMNKENGMASFEDMQKVLPKFGFRAHGFAASFEQLSALKMPVVVYIKHQKKDHFSVVRGINEKTVWLADSSFGNQTFSRSQFLEMWETRGNEHENSSLKGKFLAIFPISSNAAARSQYFSKNPERRTAQAVRHMTLQQWN